MRKITLSEEKYIPLLGFGTYQLSPNETYKSVSIALETGYRHIDTADRYENHKAVGKALTESQIKREEIFLATKVWYTDLKTDDLNNAATRFLEELKTDYLDLLLIHWPNREIEISETLEAMQKLKEDGIIHAIGVSNFNSHHLKDAFESGVKIVNNQIEIHPTFNQKELVTFCKSKGITVTAYSPTGQAEDMSHPKVITLANKYGVSPAQIILNWHMSREIVAIPRSKNPIHIRENFASQDFYIDESDLIAIDEIEQKGRILNPEFSDFDY